jgi:tetratricopeptide (TPR) repeat protein
MIHFDAKRYEEAAEVYTRGLDHCPDEATLWLNRACVFALCGKRSQALDDLRQAIALHPPYKTDASEDDDFVSLFDDPEFIAITQSVC